MTGSSRLPGCAATHACAPGAVPGREKPPSLRFHPVKILSRYVLKEHLGPLTFALSALTSLLLLNYVAKQFGNLIGKGLPSRAIAEFFLLSIPFTFALTLPMAVLVATLHAFSRMAAENEITALKAGGVSLQRIMVPVLIAAGLLTLFMVGFNDQILPRTNHELAVLQTDIAQKKPTFALREQVINEVSPGKLYLRATRIDESSNRMRDVVIYDLSDATRRRTIYADSGDLAMAPNQSDLLMTLYHGEMQDVPITAPAQLQRLFFTTDLIRVPGVANQFRQSGAGQAKGNREMSVCEMQQQVRAARQDYLVARRNFLTTAARARAAGIRLEPSLMATPTPVPGRESLGSLYCALLARIGVPALQAQELPAASHPHPRSLPAPPRPSPLQRNPAVAPPPSAGVGTAAPSIVETARVQMQDARATIAAYEIEIHKKFALAVACFIFVLLGPPIALRFPRGGVGLTIGVSLFVFALYYIGLTAGAAAASNGLLPPAVAMWAANAVFGAVALVLLARMGRESGSARGGGLRDALDRLRGRLRDRRRGAGSASPERATPGEQRAA